MSRIFISYRRSDAAAEAGRIYDNLKAHFGRESVFIDVDTIEPGEDAQERINEVLSQCQVVLVVMGRGWLGAQDELGRRRLDNPADWVRLEVEMALARQDIRVIPVRSSMEVPMPMVDDLPGGMQRLAYRQAVFVRHNNDFPRDMERLQGAIQRSFDKLEKPAAQARSQAEKKVERRDSQTKLDSTAPLITEFEVAKIIKAGIFSNKVRFETVRKSGETFSEALGNGVTLDMLKIPAGSFLMGSFPGEAERSWAEGLRHQVSVPAFAMGKYPVTQAQWRVVAALPKVARNLDISPSYFKGESLPVEGVSWHDAVEFCKRLSVKTGKQYRLPSEAEWEYACRAGTTAHFSFGNTITSELANYNARYTYNQGPKGEYREKTGEYREKTTKVGSFFANDFGLYDAHGNVWEWCLDYWHDDYEGAPTDGSAWVTSGNESRRVLRGGSWYDYPRVCRSAYRDFNSPDFAVNYIGFRVSCSAPRT